MDLRDLLQDAKIRAMQQKLATVEHYTQLEVKNLFHHAFNRIDQLVLLNQAMSEILIEKLNVSNEDIVSKMNEIDLRDGIKDGRFTKPAKDCPDCDAKINNQFHRCLFCGYVDHCPDDVVIS